jgi:phosphoribosylformylglycinamidine (FGAM) synthase PurS component
VGRFVELDFKVESQDVAMQKAKLIAETVLHNPLIETFELIPMSMVGR